MTSTPYQIAIIGAGPVGTSIAKRLVLAGHSVTLSNSRGPHTLKEQEKTSGAVAKNTEEAVSQANIVFLSVPLGSIAALSPILKAAMRPDAIVVDTGNYYPTRDGVIAGLDEGLPDSAWVAENFSPAPVVKVFNNIAALNIANKAKPRGSANRVILPVSGNDEKAKKLVLELVDEVGFDTYDAGLLAESWRQQAGEPAYCTESTTKDELVKLLASANWKKAMGTRDFSRAIFDKLPEDYSPDTLMRVARLSNGLGLFNLRNWISGVSFGLTAARVSMFSK